MKPALTCLLSALVLLGLTSSADAQQEPSAGYVFPAGGQQGTELVVTVGGQRLDGASTVYVTGKGVSATVLKHRAPIRGKQVQRVRMKLQTMRKERRTERRRGGRGEGRGAKGRRSLLGSPEMKAFLDEQGLDEVDVARFLETLRKRRDPLGQVNAQLSEQVTLRVTLAADAEPGERELRILTKRGLTNPLLFQVSRYAEVNEREPNDRSPVQDAVTALPAVINGQILPGDVDRFRFQAKQGTRLVAAVAARQLIPFLADAVPGWFQATLTLRNAAGEEVAYTDDFRFHPDPVIFFKVPADGEYVLEIKDAIYRGREDFVYRISLGALPFVKSVYPLGGRAGAEARVRLQGWNLPRQRLALRAPRGVSVVPLCRLGRDGQPAFNHVPFAVGTLPEVRERIEPAALSQEPQAVRLPRRINGRIDRAGDWDVFSFEGQPGQVVVAEVQARRLGSPLDSVLMLTDAQGRFLAGNDDHVDKGGGLHTHQADSRLMFRLPRKGEYRVRVGDAQQRGGRSYGYRLRLSAPRPDFELRVVPATINARAGMTVPVTVYALRRDGFEGAITLGLEGSPDGFGLGGARIPAGQDRVRMTLTVPRRAEPEPVRLRLQGQAQIGAREVVREAVPAEDKMQAFLWRHLVPTQQWLVTFSRGRAGPPPRLLERAPVALVPGSEAQVRVFLPLPARLKQRLDVTLSDPPAGVSLVGIEHESQGISITVRVGQATKAGLEGNLIVAAFLRWTPKARAKPGADKNTKKKTHRVRRIPLGVLPAIPFKVADRASTTTKTKKGDL